MKNLFLTAAFALAGTVAFSQATPATPATPAAPASKEVKAQDTKKACMMPDMREVQKLELTQEQLVRVREIQAECERDCAAAKAETGEMNHDAMAKHQARIQEVLTPEQYEKYVALSDKKAEHKGEHKEMEKKETAK